MHDIPPPSPAASRSVASRPTVGSTGLLDRLRRLMVPERSERADAQLALTLCLVAGMTNAGGFMVVGRYTSHMSGTVSSLADDLVLMAMGGLALGAAALIAFVSGAGCSAILINWGRRRRNASQYALPLTLEAGLLLGFGLLEEFRPRIPYFLAMAVPLLSFIMGLQNAIITKISQARIRTTHLTGMVTDIGIELGKLLYWHRHTMVDEGGRLDRVEADLPKLRLLLGLVGTFFIGGVVGAVGFKSYGSIMTLPLALVLVLLAVVPLLDDLLPRPAARRR